MHNNGTSQSRALPDVSPTETKILKLKAVELDSHLLAEVISFKGDAPPFYWCCIVVGCSSKRVSSNKLCHTHLREFRRTAGFDSEIKFAESAQNPVTGLRLTGQPCRICPGRPTDGKKSELCLRHRWILQRSGIDSDDIEAYERWLSSQCALPSFGVCVVSRCEATASHPIGLCLPHQSAFQRAGNSLNIGLGQNWGHRDARGEITRVPLKRGGTLDRWRVKAGVAVTNGTLNLKGLESLASWELRYAIQARTEDPDGTKWDMTPMRKLIELMVNRRISSFMDLEVGIGQVRSLGMNDSRADVIARGIVTYLRVFYSDVESAKEEGILYLDHFGHSIPGMLGTVDLRTIPQRWLRDAAWDYLRFRIEGPNPPRVRAILDTTRRSAIELGAFLEQYSQFRGHRPAELTASDAQSFVRDYRRRMQKGLPSRALKNSDGSSAKITANTYRYVLNGARQILRHMVEIFKMKARDYRGSLSSSFHSEPSTQGRSGVRL